MADHPPTARARPPRWALLVAALAGLVVGAGAVGGAWYRAAHRGETAAEADARAACIALAQVGTVGIDVRTPQANRIRAAAELTSAAAESDERYVSLAEQARIVDAGLATFNLEAVNSGLRRAGELCAALR